MTVDEIAAYRMPPIICLDCQPGLVIRFDHQAEQIGVQVSGEDNIRWLDVENVIDAGNGALVEIPPKRGAP